MGGVILTSCWFNVSINAIVVQQEIGLVSLFEAVGCFFACLILEIVWSSSYDNQAFISLYYAYYAGVSNGLEPYL